MRIFVGGPICLWILAAPLCAAVDAVLEPGAKLKVEAEAGSAGEGPAWHPELGVLTSGSGHIFQLDAKGKSQVYRKNAGTNGLLFDAKGRLLACEPGQRRVTRTELDGKVTVLADKYDGKRFNEPNDLTMDSGGRIYFSDPRYGPNAGKDIVDDQGRMVEGVYRIDPDGKVSRIIGRELERPNGVLVSADDRYLFVADNNNNAVGGARKLYRFNLSKDGAVDLASKKLLYDWGKGRGPDGVKQDQEGRLYVAAGLCRLATDSAIPVWATDGRFFSITRTDDELALVCKQAQVPPGVRQEGGWRRLRVAGTMDFTQVGVPASLVDPLAQAKISVFALSTSIRTTFS